MWLYLFFYWQRLGKLWFEVSVDNAPINAFSHAHVQASWSTGVSLALVDSFPTWLLQLHSHHQKMRFHEGFRQALSMMLFSVCWVTAWKERQSDWGWLNSHKTPSGPKDQPKQGRAPFLGTHSCMEGLTPCFSGSWGFCSGQVSLWCLGHRGEEHGRTWGLHPLVCRRPTSHLGKGLEECCLGKTKWVSWGEHQALTSCEQGPGSRPCDCKPQSSHLLKGLNPTGWLAVPWALHIVPGLVFKMEAEAVARIVLLSWYRHLVLWRPFWVLGFSGIPQIPISLHFHSLTNTF